MPNNMYDRLQNDASMASLTNDVLETELKSKVTRPPKPVKLRSCAELQCRAGGKCVPDKMRGGSRCQCPLGTGGDMCQKGDVTDIRVVALPY